MNLFRPEDVVADVFAGVGPFALPAGKKGCGVLANDLNPNSYKYLQVNVKDNKVRTPGDKSQSRPPSDRGQVADVVRPFCEDGRDFIRRAVWDAAANPFPAYAPRLSRS